MENSLRHILKSNLMEKTILVELLSELFLPMGFKRKGNNWVSNGPQVNRIVNLQKSQFGNSFYINYGYILNSLPLNNWKTHIENRLGFYDKDRNKRVMVLLNLDNEIPSEERLRELKECINERIISEMETVVTEDDILRVLRNRRNLYMIPPFVLKHFHLEQKS